jgi:hypothetical protein
MSHNVHYGKSRLNEINELRPYANNLGLRTKCCGSCGVTTATADNCAQFDVRLDLDLDQELCRGDRCRLGGGGPVQWLGSARTTGRPGVRWRDARGPISARETGLLPPGKVEIPGKASREPLQRHPRFGGIAIGAKGDSPLYGAPQGFLRAIRGGRLRVAGASCRTRRRLSSRGLHRGCLAFSRKGRQACHRLGSRYLQ